MQGKYLELTFDIVTEGWQPHGCQLPNKSRTVIIFYILIGYETF